MSEKKSLRVLVVFEFEGIEDPDSNEANFIVESLTYKCDRFSAEAGAHSARVVQTNVVQTNSGVFPEPT